MYARISDAIIKGNIQCNTYVIVVTVRVFQLSVVIPVSHVVCCERTRYVDDRLMEYRIEFICSLSPSLSHCGQ